MKMGGGPASLNIKITLIAIAIVIAGSTLFYTRDLVDKLQERERNIVSFYAEALEYVANSQSDNADITFLFNNIIKPIDFPIILTDKDNKVNIDNLADVRNLDYDTTLSKKELQEYLQNLVYEMDKIHPPKEIVYKDQATNSSMVLQKIHYGDGELIQKLKFYPYLQIVIATLFIFMGYIGFSNIKKNEQSNIWVGMAKETAHQFGTPISSLMGWLEMLKISYKDPDKVLDITEEISSDVEKLNKITYRFSKIGAVPELKPKSVVEEIRKVTDYFQRRLPQTGKSIDLQIEGDINICAMMNTELFEWVIENLIKNALDAIENNSGYIHFTIVDHKHTVEIDCEDSGKGIDLKRRKDIFRPGYSTKRRGWGLGLSLSKRIIEGYHKGKIYVKHSIVGQGTIFKIELNKK